MARSPRPGCVASSGRTSRRRPSRRSATAAGTCCSTPGPPASGRQALEQDDDVDRDAFAHLTVLKVNEEEGRILAGAWRARRCARSSARVVLTLGSQGSRVIAGETVADVAPRPVDGTVDPTGAGDAFSVVYLDGRARGLDPVAAAERASDVVAELIGRG